MEKFRCLPIILLLCCACASLGQKAYTDQKGYASSGEVKALKPVAIIGDKKLGSAYLYLPTGIAVDPLGNIFITDTGNDRVVKCDPDGRFLKETGGFGWESGQFNRPTYIATDNGLNVYVVDAQNERIQRLDQNLNFISTIQVEKQADFLSLGLPEGIGLTSAGEIFVSDIQEDRLVKLNGFFEYERSFGGFGEAEAGLRDPKGLFVTRRGEVYVADSQNDRIVVFDSFGNTLRTMGEGLLQEPSGIAVGPDKSVFVANTGGSSVVVFNARGELVTEYRSQMPGMAKLSRPTDLKQGKENQLLVVDSGNNRVLVFELVK